MINIPQNFKTSSVAIKPPKIVKVIRKKQNNFPETPWWSPTHDSDRYYSSMLNDKQYIYSFLTPSSALNCFNFLKKFKEINKRYPDLSDGTKIRVKDTMQNNFDIYMHDETIWAIKDKCLTNNIGLVGITYFDYTFVESFLGQKNVFNLSISAVDLLENETIDKEKQIEHFNYLLDID